MRRTSSKTDFGSLLLNWYDSNAFPYPWRLSKDPYSVWLSEIMLQQTRVNTVVPYYNNWLVDLPSVAAVTRVDMEYILKKWEGLGYYARARNFYYACQIVIDKFGGNIPFDYNDFLSLPGVGPYIASAVFSIAYNIPIPAIDGNAHRVISRINSIDLSFNKCKKEIATFLSDYIPSDRPGDFNQAIMDIGRELCTPKNPLCHICPLQKNCSAFVNNVVDKYPIRSIRAKKPHYRVAVGVIWKNSKILISKRIESGFLGGLWEFPGGKIKKGEGTKKCIIREIKEELGISVLPRKFIKQIKHTYSHFSITLDAYSCNYIDGNPRSLASADWKWIKPEDISLYAFPKANHKLFEKVKESRPLC